jgi:hypothetical protein
MTEQEILNLNHYVKSYVYCYNNIQTANIKEHEQIILSSKDPIYCYLFARDIPNANIKKTTKSNFRF